MFNNGITIIIKMSILLQVIENLNAISNKILKRLSVELDRMLLKSMFLHFLNKNLGRAYYVPNLVLSTEDTVVNKTKQKKYTSLFMSTSPFIENYYERHLFKKETI